MSIDYTVEGLFGSHRWISNPDNTWSGTYPVTVVTQQTKDQINDKVIRTILSVLDLDNMSDIDAKAWLRRLKEIASEK